MGLVEEYRGFRITGDGKFSMKCIKTIGRGSVPAHMGGAYTSAGVAKIDIDNYLSEGKKPDGKAKINTRSK